jgi:hydrogenase expression/formation protein HypD
VEQLERGERKVHNQYTRVVRELGNTHAQALLDEVFEIADMSWRGIGPIPRSGLRLTADYRDLDAEIRFDVGGTRVEESAVCIAGEVLQGKKKPHECPAFGKTCTPDSPLGAPMVSSEGACAAYWAFRRHEGDLRAAPGTG